MPFINNSKFKTINEAGRNGNEIAKKILQALRKGEKQEDIDNLVLEFYGINENKPVENEEETEAIGNNGEEEKEELFEDLTKDEEEAVDTYEKAVVQIKEMDVLEKDSIIDLINHIKEEEQEHIKELRKAYEVSEGEKDASEIQEDVNEEQPNDGLEIEDLTDALNQELDGLIDENEIDDETFSQFLANKKRDKLRALKNNEYFKIYNPASKEKYINDKVKAYNDKFSGLLKSHDRSFRDFDNGINYYLNEANLFLDDTPGITIGEIRSKCRRLYNSENGLGLVVIDYLQLISGSGKNAGNRQQEVSEISRSLKTMALELGVPVIALAQLSRAVEAREDKRPIMSDLRESGSIEQDADIVSFLFREDYYNKEKRRDDNASISEFIIGKNRSGPTTTIELLFKKDTSTFVNFQK